MSTPLRRLALLAALGLCAPARAEPEGAPPASPAERIQRSQKALDTFQRCIGGPNLPSAQTQADPRVRHAPPSNAVALDLFTLAPDVYSQWLDRQVAPPVKPYGLAAHETSHFVNAILRACKPDATGYYFFGDVFFIGTRPFETPNYSRVDELLPAQLSAMRQSFRYGQYILKSREHRGNDLRILLDEWLSSLAGAAVEAATYAAQPASESTDATPVLIDADLVGAQEFTVFTALYLDDFKATSPAAFLRTLCAADGAALLKHAWQRLQQVQVAQAQLASRNTSPRARATPPEVAAFLASEDVRRVFMHACDANGQAAAPQ